MKEGDKYMVMRKFSESNSFFNLVSLCWKLLGGMPKAWILNSLLMFALGFSDMLKLVNKVLEVNVSIKF